MTLPMNCQKILFLDQCKFIFCKDISGAFYLFIFNFLGGPPQNIPGGSSPNPASISPQTPSISLGGASISSSISGIMPTVSGSVANSMNMSSGGKPGNMSGFSSNFQPPTSGGGKPQLQQLQSPQQRLQYQLRNPEKCKRVQQHIKLLYHVQECQKREQDMQVRGEEYTPCSLPHCYTMKNVINHMTLCQEGRNCPCKLHLTSVRKD